MSYPGLLLTRLGKEVLAKGLTGREIRFSKVALGSGSFDYDNESVADLTELRAWEMDLPITNKTIDGDGYVLIEALVNNFSLARGFAARESGVYAIDPDSGEEVLYAYGNVGDEYTFIPSNTSAIQKNLFFSYRIEIQDAPNVTFNINFDFAYVSQEEFDKHLNSETPHKNAPTKLDDVDFTNHFWATDQDNHLHKISTANTKKLLLGGLQVALAARFNQQNYFNQFYQNITELGLEPNLFLLEDFKPPDTVDLLKVKMTSAARGGTLLGLASLDGLNCGMQVTIADGVNQQQVTINGIVQGSPSYVSVAQVLAFDFDLNNAYLLRTAFDANNTSSVAWSVKEKFTGYPANVTHVLECDTSADNENAFEVSDSGYLNASGFFTLKL